MFKFIPRDDGLFVEHENGRGVAHIDTRTVGETNDPNLRVQRRTDVPLERAKWRVHFTACKLTPSELEAFVAELKAAEDAR